MNTNLNGLKSNVIHRMVGLYNENADKNNVEFAISEYILSNIDDVSTMGIEELAQKCYTSPATISRYIKKLGYRNYIQFKVEIDGYISYRNQEFNINEQSNEMIAQSVINDTISAVKNLEDLIDIKQLVNVTKLMRMANHVYVLGIDYSQVVAQDIQLRFINNFKVILTFVPSGEHDQVLNRMTRNDLVIFISASGQTKALLKIREKLNSEVKHVLITGNQDMPLAQNASEVVLIPAINNDLAVSATTDRIVKLVLWDILYLLYAKTF